jgi:hypothetical protein
MELNKALQEHIHRYPCLKLLNSHTTILCNELMNKVLVSSLHLAIRGIDFSYDWIWTDLSYPLSFPSVSCNFYWSLNCTGICHDNSIRNHHLSFCRHVTLDCNADFPSLSSDGFDSRVICESPYKK